MNAARVASVERRIAAGVLVAVVSAAAVIAAIFAIRTDTRRENVTRLESAADSLAKTLGSGAAAEPILTAIVDAGAAGGAVLYDANGSPIVRVGEASAGAAEVVCRSVALAAGNGTLCIAPVAAAGTANRFAETLIAAGIAAIVVGAVAAIAIAAMARRHLRSVRSAVERAAADPTFAQRITPAGGELAPLVQSINTLLGEMQTREAELRRRTHELEAANKDLESFAHTVSHDLRSPLGSVLGFSEALRNAYGDEMTAEGREYLHWIIDSARQMRDLIDGLLHMSRLSRAEMQRTTVDLSAIAKGIAASLQKATPERAVDFAIADNVVANGDERLLRAVLENLITNAWKFTGKREHARIEFGAMRNNGHVTFYVRDNGAGFDPAHASKMFRPFQRLHSQSEFEGTGIGLATVQRILQRHGGKAWADGEPGRGATIYFTTGAPHETALPS